LEGFVSRLGGDEFIMVLPFASDANLTGRLSGLIERFALPIVLREHQFVVTLALGVAIAPANGVSADVLMRHADMALYRAKDLGGRQFKFFQPDMEFHARESSTNF
jgi:diguanylate cyclase (GGDEF)-like protein